MVNIKIISGYSVNDLPFCRGGRGLWPWSGSDENNGVQTIDEDDYPLISIITPSYNQAEYLEETIRSVLFQDYPRFEYIIIDGGSSDGSREIIKKYDEFISYWVSEPDRGQADAIIKGFKKCNGQIVAWLNSDDIYLHANVLKHIADVFRDDPETGFVAGCAYYITEESERIKKIKIPLKHMNHKYLKYRDTIIQPASFYKREALEKYSLDKDLRFGFDWDFFIKASGEYKVTAINREIAGYRRHCVNKTLSGGASRTREICEVIRRHNGSGSWQYKIMRIFYLAYKNAESMPDNFKFPAISLIKFVSTALYFATFKRIIRV